MFGEIHQTNLKAVQPEPYSIFIVYPYFEVVVFISYHA